MFSQRNTSLHEESCWKRLVKNKLPWHDRDISTWHQAWQKVPIQSPSTNRTTMTLRCHKWIGTLTSPNK